MVDYCGRWKTQFLSKDPQQRIIALVEIVKMLNSINSDNKSKICSLLINSDICNFIADIISCSNQNEMKLINKIVVCLSEDQMFFEHIFGKTIRGYIRIFNYLMNARSNEVEFFFRDVVLVLMILLKR